MYKVSNKITNFSCLDSSTIFEGAKHNALLIDHSCLSGRCGNCKARLVKGKTTAIKEELGLTLEEKKQGYILTCIHKPESDIELDIDIIENFNIIKSKTVPAKINSVHNLTRDLIKLVLRIPPNIDFNYIPGQYVNIIKGDIKRSYSIAESQDVNKYVFYIKKYTNGQMSKYLFDEAKENDVLRIEGPFGSFFFRNSSLKNIVFLATGTGIAPVISIIKNSLKKDTFTNKNVYLFHGVRYKEDLIEEDFLKESNLLYFPTLSREIVEGYSVGYIQDLVVAKNIDLQQSTVYACGSDKMIQEAKALFIKHGLNPSEFYSDAFLESN